MAWIDPVHHNTRDEYNTAFDYVICIDFIEIILRNMIHCLIYVWI